MIKLKYFSIKSFCRMFWDNANKPVLKLVRSSWNSWTPWTSEIMQINQFLNSLHSPNCSWIFLVYTWSAKGHFFKVLLKLFWDSNFLCQLCPHWFSKTSKSQGKLFFPFNSVNASLKYQHQLQWKLWTAGICFRNLSHFRILD